MFPSSKNPLAIDAQAVTEEIVRAIQEQVRATLGKKGVVVGLSGGIDSSVVAALCTRALGKERVLALFMPEKDSSEESLQLGRMVSDWLGIDTILEDISPTLKAIGCYARQIEAIKTIFSQYSEGWKCKLALPSLLDGERFNISLLTVESPEGKRYSSRMSLSAYRQLVAATNFKQRVRKMYEYFHADRLQYAVAGTPNRLEYDQGFFVKQGDGAADLKPIAHLYKTQVFAVAEYLGVPKEICSRPPTTDTFSLPQTQEEFYFALPYKKMDLCLWARNQKLPPETVAAEVGLSKKQVELVYQDIDAKRRATRYLHCTPLLITKEPEAHI